MSFYFMNLPKGVVTKSKYFRKLFRLWPKYKTNFNKFDKITVQAEY